MKKQLVPPKRLLKVILKPQLKTALTNQICLGHPKNLINSPKDRRHVKLRLPNQKVFKSLNVLNQVEPLLQTHIHLSIVNIKTDQGNLQKVQAEKRENP